MYVDIAMLSPSHSPSYKIPLHGASRTSAGLFRGKALGNILQHADSDDPFLEPPVQSAQGTVHLYLSHPLTVDPEVTPPDMTITHEVTYGLKPVLEGISRRQSPIRGMSIVIVERLNLLLIACFCFYRPTYSSS